MHVASAQTLVRHDGLSRSHKQLTALEIHQLVVSYGAVLSLGQFPEQNLTIKKSLQLASNAELVLGYSQTLVVDDLHVSSCAAVEHPCLARSSALASIEASSSTSMYCSA